MQVVRFPADASRAVELKAVLAAERERRPFLIARDAEGTRLVVLDPGDERLWIGRGLECDIAFAGDEAVSRVHAELVRVAAGWAIVDDGLSRNGTFVDGERVVGRRRLDDGETVRLAGDPAFTYRAPAGSALTTGPAEFPVAPELTPMQRKVLVALCRPLHERREPAVPATNPEIAEELVLSREAVKTHMRALFTKFELGDLPQNRKRVRLAELAMLSGVGGHPSRR